MSALVQDRDDLILLLTGERRANLHHRVEEIVANVFPADHGEGRWGFKLFCEGGFGDVVRVAARRKS